MQPAASPGPAAGNLAVQRRVAMADRPDSPGSCLASQLLGGRKILSFSVIEGVAVAAFAEFTGPTNSPVCK
jgi:hypothetical protein